MDWMKKLGKKKDYTGETFGRLTAIAINEIRKYANSRSVIWDCECVCGGVAAVSEGNLRTGHTKSCGCLVKEELESRFRDRTGDKVGRLTVISRLDNINNRVVWRCDCECGNVVDVLGDNLSDNNTFSCGCFMLDQVSGDNSASWKGGRWLGEDGYIHINVGVGVRSQREHRVIAEKVLGRKLMSDEVVHHINEIRHDNDNSNLLICTNSYHSWLHSRMREVRA